MMINASIVLFRGINVGGKNKLPMKDLVKNLQDSGFENVKSYINSGNIILSSPDSPDDIRKSISENILKWFGISPEILVLKESELLNSIKNNPYQSESGKDLHFYFCKNKPENPDLEKLALLKTGSEEFSLIGNVFYLFAPGGIGRSKLAASVEKSLGEPVTARNFNTVINLRDLLSKE